MKKHIHDFRIRKAEHPGGGHVIFELECNETLAASLPGQFAEVLVPNQADVYLRRPLSIHDADPAANTLHLFVKMVGKGTRALAALKAGDTLNLIYPLGNGFEMPAAEKVLLVGGGCGVAPLLYLARRLHENGHKPDIIIGASTADEVHEIEKYRNYGNLHILTEDGSLGDKGLVTHHRYFQEGIFPFTKVYACGPEGMLRAVNRLLKQHNCEVFVSLENTMACGIGACLSCVVKTTTGHRCVCTEGPVFNTKELAGW